MSMKKYNDFNYRKDELYHYNLHYYNDLRYDPQQRNKSYLLSRFKIKVTTIKEQYEKMSIDASPFDAHFSDMHINRETVVTLEIKESDLDRLSCNYIDMERYAQELDRIETKLNQEAQLRSKFPAVAKAYENYQMVLALMGHTKETDK